MFQGKVILVVDDESDLRDILRDELNFEGAKVHEASNIHAALELISKFDFDAVISDIRMPGGGGDVLAQRIRSINPRRPIILLITGFADLLCHEAFTLGADGYMTKPFHLRDIKAEVARLMKPPAERWMKPSTCPISKHLTLPGTLESWIRAQRFKMARGGFFLQLDPELCKRGDLISLKFEDGHAIQAWVRWVRPEENGEGPIGLGLEFCHLSPVTLTFLERFFPDWKTQTVTIPSH